MKERYAVSQMRKQANRMTFGEVQNTKHVCDHLSIFTNSLLVFVGRCLAIEVFIGKLPATGSPWVKIG